MSLEDLRRMGLLRDEDDVAPVAAHVAPRVALTVATALVALVGCVAMVFGDGGAVTWVGVVAFLAGLFAFIAVNLRAVR
ncbi:MAG: hypothetical protein ACYTJ0_01810 [Planctomycetota bacterium]|jgi:hypothetical protein